MDADSPNCFTPTAKRPTRSVPDPNVTLVVLAPSGERLGETLSAAASKAEADGAEVLVVHAGDRELENYALRRPGVRWIAAGAGATDAELRERGMSEAEGDIVTFIEAGSFAGWPNSDPS